MNFTIVFYIFTCHFQSCLQNHTCDQGVKKIKSTSQLIRYFNLYKSQIYPKFLYNIQLDYYNKEDILGGNLKNSESDLLG